MINTMLRTRHRGFTLIELMLVIGIMGLLGTLSVGGFRAMRRGMEQRSILRNVSQFVRNVYQRAEIDRQPTAVFFWNEVRRDETEDDVNSMIVIGRAVAVRLSGRVSAKDGNILIDEFGDLSIYKGLSYDNEDKPTYDEDAAKNGVKSYIYRMTNAGQSWNNCKSMASQMTVERDYMGRLAPILSSGADPTKTSNKFHVYGYYLPNSSDLGKWQVGDTYGFEIADLTLPNNYIFGDQLNVKTVEEGPKDTGLSMWFAPPGMAGGGGTRTIKISAVRPGKTGDLEAQAFPDTTEDPTQN